MDDRPDSYKSFRQPSIFVKLFLIYAGTTLALVIAVGTYNRLAPHNEMSQHTGRAMMAHQLKGIVDELGDPPDPDRGRRLAHDLGLEIGVEGPEGRWTTAEEMPATPAMSARRVHPDLNMETGKYHGRRFVRMTRAGRQYSFLFPEPPTIDLEALALLAGIIVLILMVSYVGVRWLFRPLEWLMQGVGEIASGNLWHEVRRRSGDELAQLTSALNQMVTRLREMINVKDRLFFGVSHELRAPLTRIKVALEFLGDQSQKASIQHDIRELEATITELLESARLESQHGDITVAPTDLVSLVHEVVAIYETASPGVRVRAVRAKVLVRIDEQRVRMALRNVIDNALKYTDPKGPPVDVQIEADDTDTVRLSVQDDGPGIALEEQTKIFERFYRIDPPRRRTMEGYGLGLSLAKHIMRAHGGNIVVTSEPGHGSTFIFLFPAKGGASDDAYA